jgi:hypothetical protein
MRCGWENFEGWILAGHTHGGQCKPPFLPPPVLPVQNGRYTAGEFSASGQPASLHQPWRRPLDVGSVQCRPEVTLFDLQRV